jgi:hypothetical protein
MSTPPWMTRKRKHVVLTLRALAKVTEVAREQGVPFNTALDALVRVAPSAQVALQLDSDAGTLASWRLHGDDTG